MHISNSPPPFFVSFVLPCPDCGTVMKLFSIIPTSAVQDGDEITYRCDPCAINLKRVRRAA
jgi:hypothetical protein